MPFDGVVMKCIVKELSNTIIGTRVDKIFQPKAEEIILSVSSYQGVFNILISTNARNSRIHLTNEKKINPSTPPNLCMLLRKHLIHHKVVDVKFHDFERIVSIDFEGLTQLKDIETKTLIVEIMGKYSNVILVNSQRKIIGCMKHVDSHMNREREVMPARIYQAPPIQNKISPNELNNEMLINALKAAISLNYSSTATPDNSNLSVSKFLLNLVKGFSPLLCNEICAMSNISSHMRIDSLDMENINAIVGNLLNIINKIQNDDYVPNIIYNEYNSNSIYNIPSDVHCIEITHAKMLKHYKSMSEALDIFYLNRDKIQELENKKLELVKVINSNIRRCNDKIKIHTQNINDVSNREELRLFGDLILCNMHNIAPKSKHVLLINCIDDNNGYNKEIKILLDENLSPQQNAQKYFKLYAKSKNVFKHSSEQRDKSLIELKYLEGLITSLECCENSQDICEIKQELIDQNYIKIKSCLKVSKKKKGHKDIKTEKEITPACYISCDGFKIYVGKNNTQNEYLTLKFASKKDTWLHVKNSHGAHVIIEKSGQDIPKSTIAEAAMLAVFYSKAKFSSNVQVDVTEVKNIKRQSGGKPGMVIYTNHHTVVVNPCQETLMKLFSTKK